MYVGGYFRRIGGQRRSRLAAFNAHTGRVKSWNPDVHGSLEPEFHDAGGVYALATSGRTVYAGGSFRSVGGETHPAIVAIDATSGTPEGWNPKPAGLVDGLAVGAGGALWAGGDFAGFDSAAQSYVAEFSP
jgi:hypothetical protein